MDGKTVFELFRRILDNKINPDYSKWKKVATLNPEDRIRRKTIAKDFKDIQGEIEVLQAKIKVLTSQSNAMESEWWNHLHKTYSLPRDPGYHIEDDGSILIQPDNEGPTVCFCGKCKNDG